MNNLKVAAALRLLADAFETPAEAAPEQPAQPAPAAEPAPTQKRGRGRPAKGEDTAPAAPAPAPAVLEADPFDSTPAAAPAPVATLDDVRKALKALQAATDQPTAVGVLKSAGGADNLSALDKSLYGAVVAAALTAAIPQAGTAVAEADPFETTEAVPAPSLEDVKAAVVAAQKRTSTDKVQAIVMSHGGTAPTSGGAPGPSLKALPVSKYAAVIAAVSALPSTK